VLPELREVTLVWTFTLPNSVIRHCGIASVKPRSSSADGLSWTVRASTFNGWLLRQEHVIVAVGVGAGVVVAASRRREGFGEQPRLASRIERREAGDELEVRVELVL